MFDPATPQQMHAMAIVDGLQKRRDRSIARATKKANERYFGALQSLGANLSYITHRNVQGQYEGNAIEQELLKMEAQPYLNVNNLRVDGSFQHVSMIKYAIAHPEATAQELHDKFQPNTTRALIY